MASRHRRDVEDSELKLSDEASGARLEMELRELFSGLARRARTDPEREEMLSCSMVTWSFFEEGSGEGLMKRADPNPT